MREGIAVRPDSNLLRLRQRVCRHPRPSAAISPDHPAQRDRTARRSPASWRRERAESLADATGKTVVLPRAKVKALRASTLSLMPEGLLAALNAEQVRDLMTFLLTVPLEPAPIEGNTPPPPPRKRAEVEALLGVPASAGSVGPSKGASLSKPEPAKAGTPNMHVVLCAGPKDHGKGEHDYPLWQRRWSKLLPLADNVTVSTADKWPSAGQFAKANVICFFNTDPVWNEDRGKEPTPPARGGGRSISTGRSRRQNALAFVADGLASIRAAQVSPRPIDLLHRWRRLTATLIREKFVDDPLTATRRRATPRQRARDGKLTPQL